MSKSPSGPRVDSCDTGWSLVPSPPSVSELPNSPVVAAAASQKALSADGTEGAPPSDAVHSGDVAEAVAAEAVVDFDGKTLRLCGAIDIYLASKLQRELMEIAANPPASLVVDVTGLERIDAAAAQVLLAFRREVTRAEVVRPPDEVRERLERVGVWQQL